MESRKNKKRWKPGAYTVRVFLCVIALVHAQFSLLSQRDEISIEFQTFSIDKFTGATRKRFLRTRCSDKAAIAVDVESTRCHMQLSPTIGASLAIVECRNVQPLNTCVVDDRRLSILMPNKKLEAVLSHCATLVKGDDEWHYEFATFICIWSNLLTQFIENNWLVCVCFKCEPWSWRRASPTWPDA
jgi:hypothetical protein